MTTPTSIVAYLALFAGVGFLFLLVNLLIGRLIRPRNPHAEKLEVYECGEPTIGSSFVQFDLRFYVIALLFIIFDVEVAFFFPWANVFGKATHLSDPRLVVVTAETGGAGPTVAFSSDARGLFRELGIDNPAVPALTEAQSEVLADRLGRSPTATEAADAAVRGGARRLAWLSMWDIGVFFAVLMVGFAYVWRRGDLDWVRAVTHEKAIESRPPRDIADTRQPALSA
jgi:NADH-quinone oxidoreductase subunit A